MKRTASFLAFFVASSAVSAFAQDPIVPPPPPPAAPPAGAPPVVSPGVEPGSAPPAGVPSAAPSGTASGSATVTAPGDVSGSARPGDAPTTTTGALAAAAPPAGAGARPNEGPAPATVTGVKRLTPTFGEDRYPGDRPDSPFDAKLSGGDNPWRFSMHGYFRAPLRFSWSARPEGSTKEGEGKTNIRSPFLVDDDYFRSGFAYTPVQESDWAELYLSVGNKQLTATMTLFTSLFSDWARPLVDRMGGISQGWLRYRFEPDVGFAKVRIGVKAGAFWERFGWLPKYDTYLFGRLHQIGEQVRVDVEKDRWAFWMLHGVGAHLEAIDANQGFTYGNYFHAGANYDGFAELGFYFVDTDMRDKRQLKELTDADVSVIGADVRLDTGPFGKAQVGFSSIDARNATYTSPMLEVMHSFGGRGLSENYFGTQNSENGTGSLLNIGFQYDLSAATLLRGLGSSSEPFPWGGDVTASVFGLFTHVNSKQSSPDPLVNRDNRDYWKWGAEGGYRVNKWVGASLRYDRVVLDVNDSANTYRILSPRLTLYTQFFGGEAIFVQYSHYLYNERVRLRPGQVPLETMPDADVLKVQAQMTF